ncbi:MAG: hypothetical protein IB617_01570 [Candidatus Nealsonbacteria bacterium]|nr:MAG: hypothetical protein IB617_01570 [Candidatus Nealsonbacteria bacterium]
MKKVIDSNNVLEIIEQIKFCKENLDQIKMSRVKIGDWVRKNLSIAKSGDDYTSAIKSLI